MSRLSQAFRTFFKILGDAAFADRIAQAELPPAPPPAKPAPAPVPAPVSRRTDALALLAVLQREGRFVDFLQESIEGYTDAQIGAAVRDVHRSCKSVLHRMFALEPVMAQAEGSTVRIEKGYDSARVRLTGQVGGTPPYSGTLVHPGWTATRCELPEWSGSGDAAWVVAPAEVEVR